MMEQSGDADEFLANVKLEMFTDQVFTFTPKGDLIALPRGASPIDFAYAVHTKVGDTCIGAVVNGREVPLRTQLQNGDVVKIIRGGLAEPQPGWENMVITGRARQALRRLTRTGETEEFRRIGETLALHAFKREGKSLDSVFPGRQDVQEEDNLQNLNLIDDNSLGLYVKGDGLNSGDNLNRALCCSPVLGDRIIGLPYPGHGIFIHTIDCDELAGKENQIDDWIDLSWRRAASQAVSTGRIIITVQHIPGSLADVTKIISESMGNLTNIKTFVRSPTFFDMTIDIEVRDNRHLMSIIAALRASPFVVKVNRSRAMRAYMKAKP